MKFITDEYLQTIVGEYDLREDDDGKMWTYYIGKELVEPMVELQHQQQLERKGKTVMVTLVISVIHRNFIK